MASKGQNSDKKLLSPHQRLLLIGLFLAGLTWLVFGQTLNYPFINYDDPAYTYENSQIVSGLTGHGLAWAFTHVHCGNWHPLTSISHMLDCQFFALKPSGHHFTNVFLHTIAVLLLFVSLWQMTNGPSRPGNIWNSAFVAAVFAIHPLRVESVAWIAERKDVLSGVFFMLVLLAYVHYARKPAFGRYVTMSILFALGLMSKPMLVTTPFVLLLLDYWPLRRLHDRRALWRLIVEKIPLFALSAASAAATILAQRRAIGSFEQLPLGWRIDNAIVSYIIYIWQMFWPQKLALFYPHLENHVLLWQILSAAAFLVGSSIIAIALRRKYPYLLTGWFWYLGTLLPVIGLIQVGLQGRADRYTYLPQIGLYLIVTWIISDLTISSPFRRQILSVAAAIVIGVLAWSARTQAAYWRDSESLWNHTISVTSNNYVAHGNLADLLMRRGRVADSISHSQEAVRIHPKYADAQNNLGLAYLQLGNEKDAAIHLEQSLKADPRNLNARVNLAWVLATSGDPSFRDGPRAIELIDSVARGVGYDNPIVLRTLAAAYAETGRFSDAIAVAERGVEIANAIGNAGLAADLQNNIAHYQLNQPLRSQPSP
jgi:tetratricopeptide (TPR) repeat protein